MVKMGLVRVLSRDSEIKVVNVGLVRVGMVKLG